MVDARSAGNFMKRLAACLDNRACKVTFSVVFALVTVFLIATTDRVMLSTAVYNDDWEIGVALSGRMPDSGLCLFVNALISQLVLGLSQVAPGINWFVALELFATFLAFAALCYVALDRFSPPLAVLVLIGLEVFVLPRCTYMPNFTLVAAICTMAGLSMLISAFASSKRAIGMAILGVILTGMGSLFRFDVFLLSLPFFGIALIALVMARIIPCVRSSREGHAGAGQASRAKTYEDGEEGSGAADALPHILRSVLIKLIPLGCAVMFCAAAWAYDGVAWSQPEWQQWKQFNAYRSQIADYPVPSYASVARELNEIGVSDAGYYLLNNWGTGDTDYFTLERMAAIEEIYANHAQSPLPQGLMRFAESLPTDMEFLLFVGALVVALFFCPRRRMPYVGIIFILTYVCCSYFYGGGRFPERVEIPLLFYALLSVVILCGKEGGYVGKKLRALGKGSTLSAVCALVFVGANIPIYIDAVAHFEPAVIERSVNQQSYVPQTSLAQFANADDDNIYVWDARTYFLIEKVYDRYLPTEHFLNKNICAGGWYSDAPFYHARNESVGMANIIKGLVENEHAYFVSSNQEYVDMLTTFIQEQYDPSVEVELVKTVASGVGDGRVGVFKFAPASQGD